MFGNRYKCLRVGVSVCMKKRQTSLGAADVAGQNP
jgi:hypothetical protein